MSDHDLAYYFKCFIGGALACGLTHTVSHPFEVLRVRGMMRLSHDFKQILFSEGAKALIVAWVPNLLGHAFQGAAKYGFYEIFKDIYADIAGEKAYKYRMIVYGIAAAHAEAIADVLFCPFSTVKVRILTAKPGTYPTEFGKTFNAIYSEEGVKGFYKWIVPTWKNQITSNVIKFVAFERIVEAFYKYSYTEPKDYSTSQKLSITFISGYLGGVLAAIVLQICFDGYWRSLTSRMWIACQD